MQESAADLATLTHLDEPCILHALTERFAHDEIYTWTGPILVAVNPWKQLPHLYSEEALRRYLPDLATGGAGSPRPHPFAVAAAAHELL